MKRLRKTSVGSAFDRRSVLAGGSLLLALGMAGSSPSVAAARGEVRSGTRLGATENLLRPEMFGAVANGRADDSDALAAFARALGDGVNGRMDGRYRISRAMVFAGKRGFELRGTGTITVAPGTPTNERHTALHFTRSSDFLIEGLTVDGNRSNRPTAQDSGHLIRVDSCHRASFRNVMAANGTTDGWYVAALATGNGPGGGPAPEEIPSDLSFENCGADGCYRNGLSIIDAHRVVVRGGTFSRSHGHYDDTGKGPCSGIDIEPNRGSNWIPNRVRDVLLEGVTFEGNQGFQLMICEVGGVHGVTVRDCSFIGNRRGAIEISAAGVQLLRPRIVGFGDEDYTRHPAAAEKRGLIDFPAFAKGGALVRNPIFDRITARRKDLSLIYSHGACAGRNRIIGIEKNSDCALGVRLRAPEDTIT
jgi:hypothetical protein